MRKSCRYTAMAITRLIRIKERKSGDPSGGLKSALCYICNPKKSGWIGGFSGPTPERAYEVMKRNKEYWNKTGGSAGFHYVISFPPESGIDVKTAASVAEDFAQELLGGKYYYMYSVHTDKAHLHVHVVFDSVGIEDGVKYHSPKGDWEKRIQPITDKVCKKYGLPPLEYGEAKTSVDYGEWRERKKRQEERAGKTNSRDNWETKEEQADHPYIESWFDLMRDDIDEAIANSPSYGSFLKYMQSLGYTVRDGKYLSLKPEGRERAVRTLRLGKGYSKEEIRERIEYARTHPYDPENFRRYGDMETVRRLLFIRKKKDRRWHMSTFQRTFYRRWRNTCLIRRPDRGRGRGSRAAVLQLEELSDDLQFMIHEDIRSEKDLEEKWDALGTERKAVQSELSSVKTRLYRSSVCRLMKRREELMTSVGRSPAEEDELREIERAIKKKMPLDQAVKLQSDLLKEKTRCMDQLRELRSRERLLNGIDRQLWEQKKEEEDMEADQRKQNQERKRENSTAERKAPQESEERTVDARKDREASR